MHREENQLDATEWFIALVICFTYFGHLCAHNSEFDTILVLLPHMVCNALVADGRRSGAEQQAMRPGRIVCCPAPVGTEITRGNKVGILPTAMQGNWRAWSKTKKDMQIKKGKLNNYGRI